MAGPDTLLICLPGLQVPVATFQSGPVNSLRGAALLTGIADGAVIDVGGTTTDVGLLVGGLPRPAPRAVRLAGAATNFQMPDVLSIGLGGGSLVRFPQPGGRRAEAAPAGSAPSEMAPEAAACTVGPDSVGAGLPREALCVGGGTCTASDVAVLLGRMELGSREAAAAGLSEEQAEAAWAEMQRALEDCLDAVKTEADGGSCGSRWGWEIAFWLWCHQEACCRRDSDGRVDCGIQLLAAFHCSRGLPCMQATCPWWWLAAAPRCAAPACVAPRQWCGRATLLWPTQWGPP